ncbi:hypothetical protein Syun_001250 [Stephania yunnanensis]|uniref:Uncharacterized protein n=1 Tax=Stephania yunnanensis TaxID=152371 RepID=A0AAP0LGA7_9MAGN
MLTCTSWRLINQRKKPWIKAVTAWVFGVLCSSSDFASFPEVIHERDCCIVERLREDQFEQLKMLVDIGDILGACGSIKRTEKGIRISKEHLDYTGDDEAVYYKVAGECPKGHVYSLRLLGRKKRKYIDHDASTS